MATYMAMALDVAGVKTNVWQKVEVGTHVVVTSQIVSYVDANGRKVDLPEKYEMDVISGIEHDIPGAVE